MMWFAGPTSCWRAMYIQVLKKVSPPPCDRFTGARYRPGIYTSALMFCVRLTPIEGCVTALTGPSTRVLLYLRLPAHRWIAFTTAKEPHLPIISSHQLCPNIPYSRSPYARSVAFGSELACVLL